MSIEQGNDEDRMIVLMTIPVTRKSGGVGRSVVIHSSAPLDSSLDSSLETTAHHPEEAAQDAPGEAIYRHAYRTSAVRTVRLSMSMWPWRGVGIVPVRSATRRIITGSTTPMRPSSS